MNNIIGYFFAIALTVIFGLYCSARVGFYLLIVLILAPILSVIYMKLVAKFIDITMETSSLIMAKSNTIGLRINVKNNSFLPTPILHLELIKDENYSMDDESLCVALFPKESQLINIELKGLVAGGTSVGIKKAYLRDFFGVFKHTFKEAVNSQIVGIIPEIGDVRALDQLVKSAATASLNEETADTGTDEAALNFGGFPGYDYREYRPGDPLKRINSKLSAKKDILMVRLDEKQAISRIALVLDPASNYVGKEPWIVNENALETLLGIAKELIDKEYEVDIYVKELNADKEELRTWNKYVALKEDDVIVLARKLATYRFIQLGVNSSKYEGADIVRVPASSDALASTVIYVSPYINTTLGDELIMLKNGSVESICTYEAASAQGGVV